MPLLIGSLSADPILGLPHLSLLGVEDRPLSSPIGKTASSALGRCLSLHLVGLKNLNLTRCFQAPVPQACWRFWTHSPLLACTELRLWKEATSNISQQRVTKRTWAKAYLSVLVASKYIHHNSTRFCGGICFGHLLCPHLEPPPHLTLLVSNDLYGIRSHFMLSRHQTTKVKRQLRRRPLHPHKRRGCLGLVRTQQSRMPPIRQHHLAGAEVESYTMQGITLRPIFQGSNRRPQKAQKQELR